MRRFPHGGTSHPPVTRPGNGYGRPSALRPGPMQPVDAAPALDSSQFCAPIPMPVLVWEVARNNRPLIAWTAESPEVVAIEAAAPSEMAVVSAPVRKRASAH